MRQVVVVKGGGDLATGIACRLYRCGYRVVVTELACPTVIRRQVAFAQAVFDREVTVEGISARRVDFAAVAAAIEAGYVPVVIDPAAAGVKTLNLLAMVDAVMAKRNTGTKIEDAPVVIGVGPGFTAGVDVHAVVETSRGHDLGRVLYTGIAQPDTGLPGAIAGYTAERLLRAPTAGSFFPCRTIGDTVVAGEIVGRVAGFAVTAGISGVLRGLISDQVSVTAGMKIGDIDPRGRREYCFTISDKASAVAGGVLEALLRLGVVPVQR